MTGQIFNLNMINIDIMKKAPFFEDKKAYDAYIKKWRLIQTGCIIVLITILFFLIYLVYQEIVCNKPVLNWL